MSVESLNLQLGDKLIFPPDHVWTVAKIETTIVSKVSVGLKVATTTSTEVSRIFYLRLNDEARLFPYEEKNLANQLKKYDGYIERAS